MQLFLKYIDAKNIYFVLSRFRKLPTTYWIILAAIFSVADFLTWSFLGNIPPDGRLKFTIGLAMLSLIITIVVIIKNPTEEEKIYNARIYQKRARKLYNKKLYNESEQLLNKAIKLDPSSVAITGLLGRIYVRQCKLNRAIPLLTFAIENTNIVANRTLLLNNRGLSYYLLGKLGKAIEDYTECIRESVNHYIAYRMRALCWFLFGRYENALDDVNAILIEKPYYICGLAVKAIILKHMGEVELAEQQLALCEEQKPKKGDGFYCLSIAYAKLRDINQTIDTLRIAIEQEPKYRPRILLEPIFNSIRNEPEFVEIISKWGVSLPEKENEIKNSRS